MRKFLYVMLAVTLSACVANPARESKYPAEIVGMGNSQNFPFTAAGYRRGRSYMYAPDMKDYSIAYNRFDSRLQNAVTLYFYESPHTLREQFKAEKSAIIKMHQNVTIGKESAVTFNKNGILYKGMVARFHIQGMFSNVDQPLSSELILIRTQKRFLKIRSTAPLAEGARSREQVRKLMDVVNWAY